MFASLIAFFRNTRIGAALGWASVALVLAAVAVLDAVKDVLPQKWQLGVAIVLAVAAAIAAVYTPLSKEAERRRRARTALRRYPAPRASEFEATDVGATKSELVRTAIGGTPRYVKRKLDDELDRLLEQHRFVVVRGASKAGKSRTAFEAVKRMDGDPHVVAPNYTASVAEIVDDNLWPAGPCVLWLDKLDAFLERGGLTAGVCGEILRRDPPVTIVGTIETAAWSKLANSGAEGYDAVDVLAWAEDVELEDPTEAELREARKLYKLDFAAGIAEAFVAAEALRRAYDGGGDDTAVLDAAVDWQRTGMPRLVTRAQLQALYEQGEYGERDAEDFGELFKWARTKVENRFRLLERVGPAAVGRYRVPDFIIAHLANRPIDSEAWAQALEAADPDEALAIGSRSLEHDVDDVAATALQKAFDGSENDSAAKVVAASRLGVALRRLTRREEAAEYFRYASERGNRAATTNYGSVLVRLGRAGEAVGVLARAVADTGNRTAASYLLVALAESGRLDEADALLGAGVEDGNPGAALHLGLLVHGRGDIDGAWRLYDQAIRLCQRRDGWVRRRARIMCALILAERGDKAGAVEVYREEWRERDWNLLAQRLSLVGLERLESVNATLLAAR